MLSPEWLMATGVIAISGFSIATYVRVGKGEKDNDNKINRVFRRLDEVKQTNKTEFVSQPVCDVKYLGIIKLLDEIKLDVKKILANGNGKKI